MENFVSYMGGFFTALPLSIAGIVVFVVKVVLKKYKLVRNDEMERIQQKADAKLADFKAESDDAYAKDMEWYEKLIMALKMQVIEVCHDLSSLEKVKRRMESELCNVPLSEVPESYELTKLLAKYDIKSEEFSKYRKEHPKRFENERKYPGERRRQ